MNELFDTYFDMYYDDVYRLVYSYTFNKFESEDICQKCFLKLYKKLKENENPMDYIKPWLFRVAINDSKNVLKSFWYRNIDNIEDHEYNLSSKNNSLDIKNIVINLPKKYRYVIFLYYYEGYSIKEIASILKKNESTIKTQLTRARELIKKEISENEKV